MNKKEILIFLLAISLQSKVSVFENNQFSFELQNFLKYKRPQLNA